MYNIWNYNRDWPRRRKIIASQIQRHLPDVAVLQETRHDFRYERGRGQGEQIAALTGYDLTWAVGQVYVPILRVDEGLSILTHGPPERVMLRQLTRLPHERGDGNQRICLGIAIRVAGREIHVYDTHFSLSARARLSNALEVTRFISAESGEAPAVLMGDLNCDPDETPIRFLTGHEEIGGIRGEFVDCWPAVRPGDPGCTDESWNPTRRIDYVLARNLPAPPARAELIGLEPVDGIFASDHAGIVVDFPL